jgi:hypothetical protein
VSTSSDFVPRTRSEMRALETPNPVGWDAGDGVVVFSRDELRALRRWCCFEDNPPALIVAAVRGWARRVPAAHRKRRIVDWLIAREAKVREEITSDEKGLR